MAMKIKTVIAAGPRRRKRRSVVTVVRKKTEEKIRGFLLELSRDWLLLQNGGHAKADGFRLIRKQDVEIIRNDTPPEKKSRRANGKGTGIPIEDTPSIFLQFQATDELVIVECEFAGHWPFTIGKVAGVRPHSVQIRNLDALGNLEENLREIEFRHISQIGFRESYTRIFGKFASREAET